MALSGPGAKQDLREHAQTPAFHPQAHCGRGALATCLWRHHGSPRMPSLPLQRYYESGKYLDGRNHHLTNYKWLVICKLVP